MDQSSANVRVNRRSSFESTKYTRLCHSGVSRCCVTAEGRGEINFKASGSQVGSETKNQSFFILGIFNNLEHERRNSKLMLG